MIARVHRFAPQPSLSTHRPHAPRPQRVDVFEAQRNVMQQQLSELAGLMAVLVASQRSRELGVPVDVQLLLRKLVAQACAPQLAPAPAPMPMPVPSAPRPAPAAVAAPALAPAPAAAKPAPKPVSASKVAEAKQLAADMKACKPAAATGLDMFSVGAANIKGAVKGRELDEKAMKLLESASSPEEAKAIAAQLGGPDFKSRVADDTGLAGRLNAVAQKNNLEGFGFTVPPEALKEFDKQIQEADGDKTVKLAENTRLLENATPAQKTKMLEELGKGFDGHDDKKSIAVYKILASCKTKAEFDQVMAGAGGKEKLAKLHGDEAIQKCNELCGAWGRTDLATKPEVAKKFEGVLADPVRAKELSSTRPPSPKEIKDASTRFKSDPPEPVVDYVAGQVGAQVAENALDVEYDPGAKTELVLEQRRREIEGKPKLDYTALQSQVAKAGAATDDEVRTWKRAKGDTPDWVKDRSKPVPQDEREKYMTEHCESLRKQYGLSEQTMKQLCTQKLANVYAEGNAQLQSAGQSVSGLVEQQLADAIRIEGPNSQLAAALRARLDSLQTQFGKAAEQVGQTSQIYRNMFPMPPTPLESFGKVLSVVADVAASVLRFVPGAQGIAELYSAGKALATGNVFEGVAGFAGVVAPGAYGQAARFAQKTAQGDLEGAIGSYAKEMGGAVVEEGIKLGKNTAKGDWSAVSIQLAQGASMLVGAGGAFGTAAQIAEKGLKVAGSVVKTADAASRGDGVGIFSGITGGVTGMAGLHGTVGKVVDELGRGLQMVDGVVRGVDSLSRGDFGGVLNAITGELGPAMGASRFLGEGSKFIDGLSNGVLSSSVRSVEQQLQALQKSQAFDVVMKSVSGGAGLAQAIASGDPKRIEKALGGFVPALSSQAFGDVGASAAKLLQSREFHTAFALAQSGVKFGTALANGDLDRAVAFAPAAFEAFDQQLGGNVGALFAQLDGMKTGLEGLSGLQSPTQQFLLQRALEGLGG